MSKHILDRRRAENANRAERFSEIERRSGPEGSSAAATALTRRPRDRKDSARIEKYARIERETGAV